ncbi:uncharacterized protein B4U80_01369 [Leptotrombidium deliense]|uniref:Uncharacterized protein n=1 Tax=Leptotrombidium deliense TaxID=299467 RepID=A0A443RVW1_9ACAR|nr:uncharacterized protein B4U80_01369 [Leptotrombidium deliense]
MIGKKQVTLAPQTYGYRAYFDALLNYELSLFQRDSGKSNKLKQYVINQSRDTSTREIQLKEKLHLDLAMQQKVILGGCTLKHRLQLNDPSFYSFKKAAVTSCALQIKECSLSVIHFKVFEHIFEAQQTAIGSSPAIYPITRTEVKGLTIQQHVSSATLQNVVIGKLAKKIYIALVKHKATLRDYELNPFNFEHFHLNYLCSFIIGDTQYQKTPFTPDFDEK